MKSQEVIFQISQKMFVSRPRSPARTKPVRRYNITRHWNWINSYWMFWIGGLSWRFSVSSFCDFWEKKKSFCGFIAFLLFGKSNFLTFQMCFIIIKPQSHYSDNQSADLWQPLFFLGGWGNLSSFIDDNLRQPPKKKWLSEVGDWLSL